MAIIFQHEALKQTLQKSRKFWPIPQNSMEVRSSLSLVCYVLVFLLKLAEYTCVLMPLTTKEVHHDFPAWTPRCQTTFDAIKALVVSHKCLMTINHANLGVNKVYITCEASDWRTSTAPVWDPPGSLPHPWHLTP